MLAAHVPQGNQPHRPLSFASFQRIKQPAGPSRMQIQMYLPVGGRAHATRRWEPTWTCLFGADERIQAYWTRHNASTMQ